MPKISIVIPCFNAERFLLETIESVFRQDLSDYELIVVDDGSTDDSRSIIEALGTRVKAVFGPNRGASAARNRGTQLAEGEFIQYLDADDLLTTDALSRRIETLERSNSDVAYSDWQRLVEEGNGFKAGEIVARTIESVHTDPQIATFTGFWCPPAALLYRRRIVERIGGWNESLPIIQDARFLFDAARHGARFAHVAGVGAFYRVQIGKSLSRFSNRGFVRDCLENAVQIEEFWRQRGPLTSEQVAAVLGVLSSIARASFEADRETFCKAVETGNRLRPGWSPQRPHALRILSQIAGYPRAERWALTYRRLKNVLSVGRAR